MRQESILTKVINRLQTSKVSLESKTICEIVEAGFVDERRAWHILALRIKALEDAQPISGIESTAHSRFDAE